LGSASLPRGAFFARYVQPCVSRGAVIGKPPADSECTARAPKPDSSPGPDAAHRLPESRRIPVRIVYRGCGFSGTISGGVKHIVRLTRPVSIAGANAAANGPEPDPAAVLFRPDCEFRQVRPLDPVTVRSRRFERHLAALLAHRPDIF